MLTNLIDLLFTIYLISGLGAGAWVFYEFLFQNRFLFKDDLLVFDYVESIKGDYKKIESRLDTIEENQRIIISLLRQNKRND
jgi:hypothetical protein